MPLVNLQQFKRVFVEVFASIKSLSVGTGVGAPGPGNLSVENDLTVEGTIIGGETPSYKTGLKAPSSKMAIELEAYGTTFMVGVYKYEL